MPITPYAARAAAPPSRRSAVCTHPLPFVLALCATGLVTVPALAGTIDLGNDMQAVWSLNAAASLGVRAANADPDLIGIGDGGSASGYSGGPANQNFRKGQVFSNQYRLVGDVNFKKDNFGVLLRAKAWTDSRLKNQSVPVGAPSNDYAPNTRLSDAGFDNPLSKFSGAQMLDYYAYGSFDVGDESNLKVKLGSHAVNWGESLFIPGVNRYSVLDLTALRKPGTLLKEGILPVPQISMDMGIGEGLSVGAFYQLKWKPHVLDGCGTYWSVATTVNCRPDAVLVASDGVASVPSSMAWNGIPTPAGTSINERLPHGAYRKPQDKGQFGLSMKKMVPAIDTEIGTYFVNYHTHAPIIASEKSKAMIPGSVWNGLGESVWNYDAPNIKIAGLSATTVLAGWAVSGELNHTRNFPVQVSPVDGFIAAVTNRGPAVSVAGLAAAPPMSGVFAPSFERKNFTQIQISTIRNFSNLGGIPSLTLMGEAAYQHWNGIGDPYTSMRYGRGFEFGAAQHASFGGACPAAATNTANCTQDGYFTPSAWGLRVMAEAEFPDVMAGVNLKPRVFLSADIKGWSADGVFSQGRRAASFGLKAEYMRKYTLDLSYTTYNNKARFDSLHDRDHYGLALSVAF